MKSKYWLHEERHPFSFMHTYRKEFLEQPYKFKLSDKYVVKVDVVPWTEEADWYKCTVLKLNLKGRRYDLIV